MNIESIQNAVLGYTAKESTRGEKLEEGTHAVHMVEWQVLHSRKNWDGSVKTNLPEFLDPTPEFGIMFRDENGNVGWHRFHMWGYDRWDDLTDAQKQSDKYQKVIFGSNVYACKVTKDGLVRIKNNKRTADAESFVDQFMSLIDQTGETIGDAMARLLASKNEFTVKIVKEFYDNEPQFNVKSFGRVKDLVSDFG